MLRRRDLYFANTGSLWLWKSDSGTGVAGDLKLGMAAGTSPSIAAPAPPPPPPPPTSCGPTDDCTPQTFADAILNYPGINAPVTAANEYALEMCEAEEGGGAGCTPAQPPNTAPWANSGGPAGNLLNTTQTEPGSTVWNSNGGDPIQIYHDGDGSTCWGWGIKANGDVLTTAGDSNGLWYTQILNVLKNPSSDNYTQCMNLEHAVVDPHKWGTTLMKTLANKHRIGDGGWATFPLPIRLWAPLLKRSLLQRWRTILAKQDGSISPAFRFPQLRHCRSSTTPANKRTGNR